jgi:hypothetical protein
LTLKKLFDRDITSELEGVYIHEAVSFLTVKKWRNRFVNGRISLQMTQNRGDRLEAIFVNLYWP